MSRDDAVRAAVERAWARDMGCRYHAVPRLGGPLYDCETCRAIATNIKGLVDAAAPHLTADLVRERDEALAKVDHWKRMADRREQSLDALGAERNTWARQMADLNDERDDARREKADAEARMRDALNERDDALARAEAAEAEVERLTAGREVERQMLWSAAGRIAAAVALVDAPHRVTLAQVRAALRGDQP